MRILARDYLILALIYLSILLYIYFQYSSGYLITEPQALPTIYALMALVFLLAVPATISAFSPKHYAMYLHGSFIFSLILMLLLNGRIIATPFIIIPLAFSALRYVENYPGRSSHFILATFLGIEFLFVLISGIVRYAPVNLDRLIVGSIYDNENPAGVPLLFAYSDYLASGHLVVTLSPILLLLTGFLASVITENFSMIYQLVAGKGRYLKADIVGSGLVLFSCQCEGILAALPSLASLIVNLIIIPLIAESVFLVVMTNMLLQTHFMKNRGIPMFEKHPVDGMRANTLSAGILIIPLLVLLYGSMLGWEYDIFFFFGMNIIMYFDGIVFFQMFSRVANANFRAGTGMTVVIFVASVSVMTAWFLPWVVDIALQSFAVYGLMILATFGAGLAGGMVYSSIGIRTRGIFWETVVMMISILALVMLYFTVELGYSPWTAFGTAEVLLFSILLAAISYPLLWLTTNTALSKVARTRSALP